MGKEDTGTFEIPEQGFSWACIASGDLHYQLQIFPNPYSNQWSPIVLQPEGLFHAGLQRAETIHVKPGSDGNNNITVCWKYIPIEPEGFPDQSFNPVSAHSFGGFFLHTDSQTVQTVAV